MKKLLTSFFSLIMSVLLMISVTFAWFSILKNADITDLYLNLQSYLFDSYTIYFFTFNRMYKMSSNDLNISMYNQDTDTWVAPTYSGVNKDYDFQGVIMDPYDALIPPNNYYNNLIIEIQLDYNLDHQETASFSTIVNRSIAATAITEFGTNTGGPYYLSQYVYLQKMITNSYATRDKDTNIFIELNTMFETTNETGGLVYPKMSFYNGTTYTNKIDFENLIFTANQDVYLYFNFTYFEDKIDVLYNTVNRSEVIRFFQDITFFLRKEG